VSTERLHHFQEGDALFRRRILEVFLEAARRAREVRSDNIANGQTGRSSFYGHSFEEMSYNRELNLSFTYPSHKRIVPGTEVVLQNDDPFIVGEICWTMEVECTSDSSAFIVGWPVVDGEAVWSGECYACYGAEFVTTGGESGRPSTDTDNGGSFSNGTKLTLGCTTTFVGYTGKYTVGVLIHANGQWKVNRSQVTIRSLFR
jgi:hypothetical protein